MCCDDRFDTRLNKKRNHSEACEQASGLHSLAPFAVINQALAKKRCQDLLNSFLINNNKLDRKVLLPVKPGSGVWTPVRGMLFELRPSDILYASSTRTHTEKVPITLCALFF